MRLKLIVSALILLAAVAQGRASVTYSYVTDATNYTANPGATVTINIYLNETLTGSSSSFIQQQNGLFSAGAAFDVRSPAAGDAQVAGGFTFNTATEPKGFSGPTKAYYNQGTGSAANNVEFLEAVGNSASQGMSVNTGGLYFLGSQTVTVGTGTTKFALTSLDNDTINNSNSILGQSDGNTLTFPPPNPGFDLDSTAHPSLYTGADLAPTYFFTVSSPEPGSLVLGSMAASALALGAWRRWRQGLVAKT
jgi:hypothetical protein